MLEKAILLPAILCALGALVTGFGAYRVTRALGCRRASAGSAGGVARPLGPAERRTRLWIGLGLSGLALLLGVGAARGGSGELLLWPAFGVVLWFAASFLVAARTGYPGCPEAGAIASLLLRRPVATACPPLERIDRRGGCGNGCGKARGSV